MFATTFLLAIMLISYGLLVVLADDPPASSAPSLSDVELKLNGSPLFYGTVTKHKRMVPIDLSAIMVDRIHPLNKISAADDRPTSFQTGSNQQTRSSARSLELDKDDLSKKRDGILEPVLDDSEPKLQDKGIFGE